MGKNLMPHQLDLFSWDIIKIGEGFRSLSGFDFEGARVFFKEVLSRVPDHSSATRAMEMVAHWEGILQRLESLEGEDALTFFWKNIKEYPFGKEHGPELFRKALIERLLLLMDENPFIYIPPDLCSGYLYIKLGDYREAERVLKILLNEYPSNGRLLGYLGDALWMQGRGEEAMGIYTKALLSAPYEVSLEDLRDKELLELIEDEGVDMAPVYGWLRGILPLVEVETKPSQEVKQHKALRIYGLLNIAEKARQKGYHEKMVSHRRMLKEEDSKVFNAYMERMEGLLF